MTGKYYTVDRDYDEAIFIPCEIQFLKSANQTPVLTKMIDQRITSVQLNKIIHTCVQYLNDELIFVSRDK